MSEVPPPEQPQEQVPSPGAGQPTQPGGPVPPPGAVPPGNMPPGADPFGIVPPQGTFPPGADAPAPLPRPAAAGFFESLRRTGLARTNERWVGGVAGGVARRLGLDPTLVRCIWLVLTIFSGIGLVLYGLGWALMPEESDSRIHLEQALNGDFDAGLAGALATFIAGWVLLDHGLVPSWYISGWRGSGYQDAFWAMMSIGLTLGILYGAYRFFRRRHHPQQSPGGQSRYTGLTTPNTAPYATAQQSMPSAPNAPGVQPVPHATTGSQGVAAPVPAFSQASPAPSQAAPLSATGAAGPMRPGTARPRPVRPPRPRRPGPGRRLGLAIVGIACCCIAAIVLICSTGGMGPLAAGFAIVGAITALLGAGVVISALRGRRGGWMTATGWLAVLVALPTLAIGTGMPGAALSARDTTHGGTADTVTLTWDDLEPQLTATDGNSDSVAILGNYAAGNIVLDLRDMPTGAEPHTRAQLSVGVGRVTVRTTAGQNLAIDAEIGRGQYTAYFKDDWLADGQPVSDGGYWQDDRYRVDGSSVNNYGVVHLSMDETTSVTSPAAQTSGTALMLDIELGMGHVRVDEQPSEVTWYGNQNNEVWIVWYWVDANGHSHEELPVPGMTHDAINDDDAYVCEQAATDAQAAEATANGADPYEEGYSYWDGTWSDISNLTGAGREAWDNCVSEALESGSASTADAQAEVSASPSAQPSGEPSATPSAAPTPTPTH